jgi:hypothetical protein
MRTFIKGLLLCGALVSLAVLLWFRSPTEIAKTQPASSGSDQAEVTKPSSAAAATTPASASAAGKTVVNDFELVAETSKKALAGDGKAALLVADLLTRCLPLKYQYRNMTDPRAAFENDVGGRNLPQWLLDRLQANFNACSGLLNRDPFGELPARPTGYESIRFWTDLAYHENDPVALVQHAAAQQGLIIGAADSSSIEAAQADLNKGAITGDPEALFRIGLLLSDSRVGQDSLNAYAAMIAACNRGYDCTTNNEVAFAACAAANSCPLGEIYTDKIRETIGPAKYAKAYSLAMQLQDALARGDTAAVVQFVQLKGAHVIASR